MGSIVTTGLLASVAVGEGHELVHVDAELQYILPEPQVPNWDRQKISRALTTQGAPVQRLVASSTSKVFTQASSRLVGDGVGGTRYTRAALVGDGVGSGVGGFVITATLCGE